MKLNEQKEFLIFDFDGTIANTSYLHELAFKKTLHHLGVKFDYSAISGMETSEAIEKILNNYKVFVERKELLRLSAIKQQVVRKMIKLRLTPMPGVKDFIHWSSSKFKLAIVTSGSYGTVSISVKKLDIEKYFDLIICADDVNFAKPDPSGFLLALEKSGVVAKKSLVFEDSDTGIEAAKRAGIDVIDVRKYNFRQVHSYFKKYFI